MPPLAAKNQSCAVENIELVHAVNWLDVCTLSDNPTIRASDTFPCESQARAFRLHAEPCTLFSDDSMFHNPYGIWRMEPV